MASVKNKIRWGTVFLFLLVMMAGGVGIYYLVKLRLNSENMIKANYESLEYVHQMESYLDSVQNGGTVYIDSFAAVLRKQAGNITEKGEAEATQHLQQVTAQLSSDPASQQNIRPALRQIAAINMEAIKRKAAQAEEAAKAAVTIIVTVVAIIVLIGFTFVVNFPSIITTPINQLTEAIQEVTRKNYHHRIHIESKDEFGTMANAFNEMTERLEYFESSNLNKILFEKSRAEAVINSLKDASIGIDKNGVVLFANNQALQLLGLGAKDIVGQKTEAVARRNDLFRFLLEEKGATPFKIVVDNKENYFTKEVIELTQDDSNNKVIVLKNITSFKELDAAKTAFIATVSHELKTPLAASDFSLKLLEDERSGHLSAEQKELVQSLKADNQRMLRILSELLNLSQVEAGKIQLHLQQVDLYQVADDSTNAVATAAKEKLIRIEKRLDEQLPVLTADADKLSWVLNNFLTNAVKYAPPESTVVVAAKKEDNYISFAVQDTGPGIDEAYLPRLFDRYFQVPGRSHKKGSGIGLAICKEFIEAMGGTVWVQSKVGAGSSFGFRLPVA